MRIKNIFIYNWTFLFWSLIVAITSIHLFVSSFDTPGFWTDSFIYLLQADYFSSWGEAKLPVLDQAIAYRSFPPLYPYLLSLFNAGSDSILRASVVTSFLLLPFCLFYVDWQYKQGVAKIHSQINAMLFLLLPGTLLLSTEVWSESLYLLLVMMTLWSYSKSENSTNKWLYIAAFICGLVLITRTVGIALVIPFIFVTLRRGKLEAILSASIIFIPWLIWNQITKDIDYNSIYIDENIIVRYEKIINSDAGVFDGVFFALKLQLQTFWWAVQLQFNNFISIGTATISAIILIAASYTIYVRLIRLSLDALYFVIYIGIILVWNFPDQNTRFIFVLLPFLLFYSQRTIELLSVGRSKKISFYINSLIPTSILIIILPCLLFMGGRLINPPGDYVLRLGNDRMWLTELETQKTYKKLIYKERLVESAIKIKNIVPEDECVYSIYHEIVMLYSQRKSVVPPLDFISDRDFSKGLNECHYIFVIGAPHKQHEALYPIDRVKDDSWILQQTFYPTEFGGGIISALLEIDEEHKN